jgi:cobalamin biosynthetic protein CobC
MLEGSISEAPASSGGEHGGNLAAARLAFPMAPEPWLDLSTGINPYSYPVPELGREAFTRLPEPEALRGLEQAARHAYRAPPQTQVVAAPGSQALIGLLPRLLPPGRVGVLGFTYAEHAAAWRAAGAEVTIVADLAALERMDVAIIVNPNNPDGRLVPVADLRSLAASLAERGGLLVVDEAFADFLDVSDSLVPFMPEEGVVVLRSFGKAYGLPGLRLGFAVAPPTLSARLQNSLGPWPVCGPAIAIGTRALADEAWRVAARKTLRDEGAALDGMLASAGLSACGGSVLYRLVAHPRAASLYEDLGRAGILVRRFGSRPSWLRFGMTGSEVDRTRLRAALGVDPLGNLRATSSKLNAS